MTADSNLARTLAMFTDMCPLDPAEPHDCATLIAAHDAARMVRDLARALDAQTHEIVWTFETGYVRGVLVCHAPPKSDCRLTNASCDCESWEIKRDTDGTPYHEVEAWDEKAGRDTIRRHEMTWQAECNVELFVNQSDLEELCEDTFEIGRTPVTPIWEGEYYSWEPAKGA